MPLLKRVTQRGRGSTIVFLDVFHRKTTQPLFNMVTGFLVPFRERNFPKDVIHRQGGEERRERNGDRGFAVFGIDLLVLSRSLGQVPHEAAGRLGEVACPAIDVGHEVSSRRKISSAAGRPETWETPSSAWSKSSKIACRAPSRPGGNGSSSGRGVLRGSSLRANLTGPSRLRPNPWPSPPDRAG